MMSNARIALGALALTALLSVQARAQAAQKWSLLGSPFFTVQQFPDERINGFGGEVQMRYSRPGTSVGLGVQYSNHKSENAQMQLSGVFLEPRYAPDVGGESIVPYIAARFAALRQNSDFASTSNGYAVGLGAGVMYKLSRRTNLDLGAAVVRQSLGDITLDTGPEATLNAFFGYVVKAGLSIGLP